jgi:hypothetical protein
MISHKAGAPSMRPKLDSEFKEKIQKGLQPRNHRYEITNLINK